jgi:hypothetical protein
MAAKKTAKKTVKKAVNKVAAKPAKVSKKAIKEGDRFGCNVCGMVVSVDETCGCVETCDIICCDEPMKAKKK